VATKRIKMLIDSAVGDDTGRRELLEAIVKVRLTVVASPAHAVRPTADESSEKANRDAALANGGSEVLR
jgi:hypothetical protein